MELLAIRGELDAITTLKRHLDLHLTRESMKAQETNKRTNKISIDGQKDLNGCDGSVGWFLNCTSMSGLECE